MLVVGWCFFLCEVNDGLYVLLCYCWYMLFVFDFVDFFGIVGVIGCYCEWMLLVGL